MADSGRGACRRVGASQSRGFATGRLRALRRLTRAPLRESGGHPGERSPAGVPWPLRVGRASAGGPWGSGQVGQLAGGCWGSRGGAGDRPNRGGGGRRREKRHRHARTSWGRDRGQMALNPGPQTLKSRRRSMCYWAATAFGGGGATRQFAGSARGGLYSPSSRWPETRGRLKIGWLEMNRWTA